MIHEGAGELSIERVLAAAPEAVFRALTEPDLYSLWMGPEGSTTTIDTMDATEGGRLAFRVRLPDGPEIGLSGTYVTVDPPHRLVHTWVMEGDGQVTTVSFELHPHEDGTRLVLSHTGFSEPDAIRANDAGWAHQLDRLAELAPA